MDAAEQLPFQSFTFALVRDRMPRLAFGMRVAERSSDAVLYETSMTRGSASNATVLFKRKVPLAAAQRLKDGLQAAGVFGWDESYGDAAAPGTLRWNIATVFKEDVFSVASSGGSDVPPGFDAMLEELYRLDFPRPDGGTSAKADDLRLRVQADVMGLRGIEGLGGGAGGAFDISQLLGGMDAGAFDPAQASELLSQMQSNPRAFQQRMRDEFKHMPADEQEQLLDMLASTGMASRAWWERFLRG